MEKEDHSTQPTRAFCFNISAKGIMSIPVGLEVGTNILWSLHLDKCIFVRYRSGPYLILDATLKYISGRCGSDGACVPHPHKNVQLVAY